MRILVAVKRVVDPYVKIRVKGDHSAVDIAGCKMVLNPFDEIALEEAIRLKEQNIASEVVVVSIGPAICQETLRQALALGACRAILVQTEHFTTLTSLDIAKILKAIVLAETPQLVLLGKQSIDGDNNQTPQMLAGLLAWPQATYASCIKYAAPTIEVTREIDGGLETLQLSLPAVISADLRLNTPRYVTLPNIMKAKQKPLQIMALDSLGLNLTPHQELLSVRAPAPRGGGEMLDSVTSLLEKLKHEVQLPCLTGG